MRSRFAGRSFLGKLEPPLKADPGDDESTPFALPTFAPRRELTEPMTPQPSERARVLLADDDESTTITLSVLLEDAGYDVDIAASCAAARALLAREVRYANVLLDYHLGDGLGTDLIPEARKRLPGARIILMSGSGGAHRAADGCFVKGGRFDDLLRVLAPPQERGSGERG